MRVPPSWRGYNRGALGGAGELGAESARAAPGYVWTYDFVKTYTRDGVPVRVLNVLDKFTRVAVAVHIARSIGSRVVLMVLEKAFEVPGRPKIIRSDNGSEFIGALVVDRLGELGVRCALVEKASPQQNPFIESYHSSMRDELLNGELFHSVTEARVVITAWVEAYTTTGHTEI